MFSKALVATDLSPVSDKVLEYVKSLRPLGCREIVLAHVIYVKHMVGLSEALAEEAVPRLAEQERLLREEGFAVTTEMPVGVPGPEITYLAETKGCKLVVVGSHGHSAARDIALGHVPVDVVHRSKLPILVVRLQILEGEPVCYRVVEAEMLSNVLYATDFSETAERAFKYVEEFAQNGCKKMTLMHVQDVSRIRPYLGDRLQEFNEIDRSRLERMASRLRDLGVEDIDLRIPYGAPAKEIVDHVKSHCSSIVVMGTHGRGFIADIFAGSVAHNVVRLSESPVLLIPPVR